MKTPIRWFRFFTVPVTLASVGATIAAAELSSPDLMLIAAGAGCAGIVSLLVGRNFINPPDKPAFVGPVMKTVIHEAHAQDHAVAHR
jgi:hypothetical protein